MQNRKVAKKEGYRNGGSRTGGMQERRVQDRRDAEQERCWKRGMQEKREEGKEGRTKIGMKLSLIHN